MALRAYPEVSLGLGVIGPPQSGGRLQPGVGEGQHVGLRVLDTVVPAGSSFVVYVDAEFR